MKERKQNWKMKTKVFQKKNFKKNFFWNMSKHDFFRFFVLSSFDIDQIRSRSEQTKQFDEKVLSRELRLDDIRWI